MIENVERERERERERDGEISWERNLEKDTDKGEGIKLAKRKEVARESESEREGWRCELKEEKSQWKMRQQRRMFWTRGRSQNETWIQTRKTLALCEQILFVYL
jgi:hypothetical protein